MSPHTSNYSRLSCFSKINKSFFHSFYCFCIPRKKSQGPQSPRRGPELQPLAMLGVLGPTIRAKSDCGCALSLNSFWPPILRSQRPKKMFLCRCKKFKRGFKWLGLFFIKFAQQIVMVRFSACAVPHVSSEKETRPVFLVGVDKGNKLNVALPHHPDS